MSEIVKINVNELRKGIAERMKVLRAALGINQKEMSKIAQMNQSNYSAIEMARTTMQAKNIIAVHQALGDPTTKEYKQLKKYNIHVTCDWLLTGEQALID